MDAAQQRLTPLGDLRPNMKSVACQFIVLDKSPQSTKTRDGNTIHQLVVADSTAAITLSLWDDLGELVESGDILRLTNGWASLHKGALHLYAGNKGKVRRIGQYNMLFVESPNMSHYQWQPDPNNPDTPMIVPPPSGPGRQGAPGQPTPPIGGPPIGQRAAPHGGARQPPSSFAGQPGGPPQGPPPRKRKAAEGP